MDPVNFERKMVANLRFLGNRCQGSDGGFGQPHANVEELPVECTRQSEGASGT